MNKNIIIGILIACCVACIFWAIYCQNELNKAQQAVVEWQNKNNKIMQDWGEEHNKFINVDNNFKALFEFVNDKRFNNGRGVLATYGVEYQNMPIWKVAQSTKLQFNYIEY